MLKNVRVPIRPHFGVMGLAPKEADIVELDSAELHRRQHRQLADRQGRDHVLSGRGRRARLFSVGDSHASQGDSELCGTAIECSLTGTFQIILHKKADLAGHGAREISIIRCWRPRDEWVVHGFSFPNYLAELGRQGAEPTSTRNRRSISRCAMHSARCAAS